MLTCSHRNPMLPASIHRPASLDGSSAIRRLLDVGIGAYAALVPSKKNFIGGILHEIEGHPANPRPFIPAIVEPL